MTAPPPTSPPAGPAGTGAPAAAASGPPAWRAALLLAVALPALALGLDRLGAARRTGGPGRPVAGGGLEVVVVRRSAEVPGVWAARGERGRLVVHAGRFLHFLPADPASLARLTAGGAGTAGAVDAAALAGADQKSGLWAAAEAGLARRIAFVVPGPTFEKRLAATERLPGGATAAGPRDLPGLLRDAALASPATAEPVLLDVSASWFDEADGAALLAALAGNGTVADLVTCSRAEDVAPVKEASRLALDAFCAALAAPRGAP